MTKDDVIRMAIEAGLHDEMWFGPHTPTNYEDCLPKIKRFAALVAAAEREACAKTAMEYDLLYIGSYLINEQFADAIRARGQE